MIFHACTQVSSAWVIVAFSSAALPIHAPWQAPSSVTPPVAVAPTNTAQATAAPAPAAPAKPAPQVDFQTRIDSMLAAAWLADLYPFTRDPDISDEGYEAALALAMRCAQLSPQRRSGWDMVILLADQIEGGAPEAARVARREAFAALSKLDPNDDVIRLARLADAIEMHPTAEARVKAYESALDPQHRKAIGAPAAARLAYQLATLESRIGNTELFARWLGESVKTDPSFPTAAQAAAGFFRMRVEDPAADIELLSVAVEANPRDLTTWSALLSVLLDGGAFRGAERVARLAIAVADGERRNETVYSLTGDLATALWGSGQRDAAMRELELRMGRLTEDYRRIISLMDPSITTERLNREYPPLPSTLSIAMLGLAKSDADRTRTDSLIERAMRGTDAEVTRAKQARASAADLGGYDIQRITTLLLFSKDVSKVASLIDSAATSGALGEAGKARFLAMLDWRQGKLDEAIKSLSAMQANDPLAQYALGSALLEAKRQAEAAQTFRTIAEAQTGTSIGLLALDRLAEALGQPVLLTSQLSTARAERAEILNKALDKHLPKTIDEIVDHPLRALTLQVTPSTTTVKPYEPFTFNIKMRNSSRLPFAIGSDAPISGKISMRSAAPTPNNNDPAELPPQPVLIDRRLRLAPGEEINIDVDSDLTMIGLLLNVQPLDPHLINVAVVSNPSTASGGTSAGFLGTVTGAPPIQFTGVVVNESWVNESRSLIKSAGNLEGVIRLALLIHALSDSKKLPESMRADTKPMWDEVVAAWKALPERAQAWIVGVMPQETPALAPILDAIRSSTSPFVLRSWAITRVVDPKDPMLDVCRRSSDPDLGKLADAVGWVADRRAKRAVDEVGMEMSNQRPAAPVGGSK